MSDPYIAEIRIFAGNFAPRNWAFCDGQLLSISQNTALFAVVGTTYGGDGRTDFALPDIRGRAVIGAGSGPGLSSRTLGQEGGTTSATITEAHLPSHGHGAFADAVPADDDDPQGGILASTPGAAVYGPATNLVPMAPDALTSVGSGGEHTNMQPHLVLQYIIALHGIFPTPN